jgi:F-type H+-transporting ATPase subunit delta
VVQGLQAAAAIVADPRVAEAHQEPEVDRSASWSASSPVWPAKLDAGMQNFVRVLAENHRLLLLPEIAAQYEALRARSRTASTSRWCPPWR